MDIVPTQQAEADEPGSVQYNYQIWRQQRVDQVLQETQAQAHLAGIHSLQMGGLYNAHNGIRFRSAPMG